MRQKALILAKLDELNVPYCTVDGAIPDGMVRDQKHVGPVIEHLARERVDGLFVPHCNFGTEGAVGMIAKKLGVPVLLWGPRDEAPLPDGSRLRDSLCGMFASSKVLGKLGVPFTYIENGRIDDASFASGVRRFVAAASVVKAMRGLRIGQVGVRIGFFWTTIHNESELLERFGIEVLPFDMADLIKAVKLRAARNSKEYAAELEGFRPLFEDAELLAAEGAINQLALRDELLEMAEREELDALSIKTFTSIQDQLGDCIPLGITLAAEKIPVASESDVHGAVSSVLLEAAAGRRERSFLPEYTVRHPENENAVLLWHGMAPFSLRHPETESIACFPPWILKNVPGQRPRMRMKDGPLTVCRFDGDGGDYVLGIGQGKSVPGPVTREAYVWMEVDDWPRWERRIMEGPYIHHCSAVYGHCADALEEACRYIPGLRAERFDRQP
jgi:L-fucose isomerase-like protein